QGVSGRLGQIVKADPHVASRRTGKIFPPDLVTFLRQVGVDAVWIERLSVFPNDLGGFWINLKTSFLADRAPSFPLLVCHHRFHLLSLRCAPGFVCCFPLGGTHNPLEVLGSDAAADEFIANMDGVPDATCEGHGPSALSEPVPVADDVADKFGTVHELGELRLDVIAPFDAYAAQVWIDGSIDARFHEVALRDQRGDLRTFNHHVEKIAQPETIASAWRRGEAKQCCLWISVNGFSIGGGPSVVSFVDN